MINILQTDLITNIDIKRELVTVMTSNCVFHQYQAFFV